MNQVRKSTSVRVASLAVIAMLVLSALAVAGCGGTKESPGGPTGTGAPENVKFASDTVKAEALKALKAAGGMFGENYVQVTEGPLPEQIAVNGPVTLKGKQVNVVVMAKGKSGWTVVSAK